MLICIYVSDGVTKKLSFIVSDFKIVQATLWNTNNGEIPFFILIESFS